MQTTREQFGIERDNRYARAGEHVINQRKKVSGLPLGTCVAEFQQDEHSTCWAASDAISSRIMRTTLDIDDDVLSAAKELGAREKKTAGKILSEFFRRALHAPAAAKSKASGTKYLMKNGIPVLPSRGEVVTVEKVRRIMEEEGI